MQVIQISGSSSFDNGLVAGYKGGDDSLTGGSEDEVSADSQGTVGDGTGDEVSDGSEGSMDESGEGDSSGEEMSDGSSEKKLSKISYLNTILHSSLGCRDKTGTGHWGKRQEPSLFCR